MEPTGTTYDGEKNMGYERVLRGAEPTSADLMVSVDDLMTAAMLVIAEHGARGPGLGVAVRQLETALTKASAARGNIARVAQLLRRAEAALTRVAEGV